MSQTLGPLGKQGRSRWEEGWSRGWVRMQTREGAKLSHPWHSFLRPQ